MTIIKRKQTEDFINLLKIKQETRNRFSPRREKPNIHFQTMLSKLKAGMTKNEAKSLGLDIYIYFEMVDEIGDKNRPGYGNGVIEQNELDEAKRKFNITA